MRAERPAPKEAAFQTDKQWRFDMIDFNCIEEKYRLADAYERLNLFLDCRDLREDFMAIEKEEAPPKRTEMPETGVARKIMGYHINRFPRPWRRNTSFLD
jgi:hypothetical protein